MIGSLLVNSAKQVVNQTESKAVEIKDKIQGKNPALKSVQATLLKARGMSTDGAKELLKGKLPSGGVDKLRALNENAANVSQINSAKLQHAASKSSDAFKSLSSMSKKSHDTAKSIIGNLKG